MIVMHGSEEKKAKKSRRQVVCGICGYPIEQEGGRWRHTGTHKWKHEAAPK